MANNPHLQLIYVLESTISEIVDRLPNLIEENILDNLDDGRTISEDNWSRVIFRIALVQAALRKLEDATLLAYAEMNPVFSYEQANRERWPEGLPE